MWRPQNRRRADHKGQTQRWTYRGGGMSIFHYARCSEFRIQTPLFFIAPMLCGTVTILSQCYNRATEYNRSKDCVTKGVIRLKIIAVDPAPEELEEIIETLRGVYQGANVKGFGDPLSAVKYAYRHPANAAEVGTCRRQDRLTRRLCAPVVPSAPIQNKRPYRCCGMAFLYAAMSAECRRASRLCAGG